MKPHQTKVTSFAAGCRGRHDFVYEVRATIEPSYYGPNPSVRCGSCDQFDGDLFPGRFREWS